MRKAGRSPVVVVAGVVGLLVILGLAIGPWMRLTQLQQELAAKQQAIATLTSQNQTLQQQAGQLEDERKELEKRVAGLRTQLASATEELAKLHDLQGNYDLLRNEKTRLDVEVTRLTRERNEANERLRRTEEDNHVLEQGAARLRNRLILLDRDYQQLVKHLTDIESRSQTTSIDPYAPVTLPSTRPRSDIPFMPEMPASTTEVASEPTMEWRQTSPGPGSQMVTTTVATPPSVPALPRQSEPFPAARQPLAASRFSAPSPDAASTGSWRQAAASHAAVDEMTPQTIELPPIIIRKSQAAMGTLVRGRVVEVNASHRFVVIDQGLDQGVRVGMTFDLLQGNNTAGQAVVVRVRQGIAACDLVTSAAPDAIHIGDLAIQRGP